jgi:hypothetical protein
MVLIPLVFCVACAVRYPPLVIVREAQYRSADSPAALPLDLASRAQLLDFLNHGGNRTARNPSTGRQAAAHRALLDALSDSAHLTIRADLATSDFCAIAAPLCRAAPILVHRKAVSEVIDARNPAPEVPSPLAVCDDEYCWIFHHSHNRLTDVLVVRGLRRPRP